MPINKAVKHFVFFTLYNVRAPSLGFYTARDQPSIVFFPSSSYTDTLLRRLEMFGNCMVSHKCLAEGVTDMYAGGWRCAGRMQGLGLHSGCTSGTK